MTVCNMTIEAGARAGLIAPDETTFDYLKGRPMAPKGGALGAGRGLLEDAALRRRRDIRQRGRAQGRDIAAGDLGHQPAGRGADHRRRAQPEPTRPTTARAGRCERALDYMGLTPGTPHADIAIDTVFIGSCTNGRIEDLRAAAAVVEGPQGRRHVDAMVVPGSGPGQAPGRGRGPGPDLRRGRLRVARARLLHVPRHEPRPAQARRALRLHLEPQLRGPPGPRRTHPSAVSRPWPPPPPSPATSPMSESWSSGASSTNEFLSSSSSLPGLTRQSTRPPCSC